MKNATRHLAFVPSLAILLLSAWCAVAAADIPWPPNCTIPSHIVLVGTDAGGTPDPLGTFTISLRGIGGDPFQYGRVVLVFHNATDLRVGTAQPGNDTAVDCDPSWGPAVMQTSGANGILTFTVLGRADHGRPTTSGGALDIYADGVLLGTIPVAAFDHDGGGVGATDLALWAEDLYAGNNPARSDYDGDGVVGAADLSLWAGAFFAAGSILPGAAPLCP